MAQICSDLNELCISGYTNSLSGLISLIDAQRNLKSISLYPWYGETFKGLSEALARKCSTINYLGLESVSAIQPSFLTLFINLKKLSIYEIIEDFELIEVKDIKEFLAISEFSDLQSLYVRGLSCFKELALLIERTKGNISDVLINTRNKTATNSGIFIKAIANNCSKIRKLAKFLAPNDFIHVKSLLLNCKNLEAIGFFSLFS